jgi:hypothetical protein
LSATFGQVSDKIIAGEARVMDIRARARREQLKICPEPLIRNAIDLQVQLLFRRHYIVILFPQIAGGYEGIADETQAWRHHTNFATRLQHANPLLYRRFDFTPRNVLDSMNGKKLVERVVLNEIKMSKICAILKIPSRCAKSGVGQLPEPISSLRTTISSVDIVR